MEPTLEQRQKGWSRRRTLMAGAGAAALATRFAVGRNASAQIIRTGGGIAGGGEVKEQGARAHFSVFASRFQGGDLTEPVFVGQFQWVDGHNDVAIASTGIEFYGPVEGEGENFRIIRGTARLNGENDDRPFVVKLTDAADGPGTGNDSIAVFVGDQGASDAEQAPFYTLAGNIDSGDIELLQIELPF